MWIEAAAAASSSRFLSFQIQCSDSNLKRGFGPKKPNKKVIFLFFPSFAFTLFSLTSISSFKNSGKQGQYIKGGEGYELTTKVYLLGLQATVMGSVKWCNFVLLSLVFDVVFYYQIGSLLTGFSLDVINRKFCFS